MLIPSCQNLALLLASWVPAISATTDDSSVSQSHAKLEFLADEPSIRPGKQFWIGVLFHLDQGWHIYWQNPGDSGEPPKIQWQMPSGFTIGQIHWPQPVRLGSGSIVDYGYEGSVLLMAPVVPSSGAGPALIPRISADVKYIVCREICLPGNAHLSLSFPLAHDASELRTLFEQVRHEFPKPAPAPWKVTAQSDNDYVTLSVRTDSHVERATFFPLVPGQIENSAPQDFASTGHGFRLTLRKSDQLTKPIAVLRGLVVLGPQRAFEVAAPVSPGVRHH